MSKFNSKKIQLSTLKCKAWGTDYMREIGLLPDLAKKKIFYLGFLSLTIAFHRAVREGKAISKLSHK